MHFDFAQCKQKGFAPILILVGILILALVGSVTYYFGKPQFQKSQIQPQNPMVTQTLPSPTSTQNTIETPDDITLNFYKWFLDCDKKQSLGNVTKIFAEACPYPNVTSDFETNLTAKGTTVLCNQEIPDSGITVDKAIISDNTATVTTHLLYSQSGDRPQKTQLKLIANQWKLDNLICSPR